MSSPRIGANHSAPQKHCQVQYMPRDPYNLGGAKARMRAGSSDLLVTYGNERKPGYYELCPYGKIVYRRVEFPEWISTVIDSPQRKDPLLSLFQRGLITIPETSSNERQGHIWFNPKAYLGISLPCVGVDSEIVRGQLLDRPTRMLQFVCYKFGKSEVERWRIPASKFLRSADLGVDA